MLELLSKFSQFQVAWLQHKVFMKFLEDKLFCRDNLPGSLKDLSVELNAWNKETFGNIFQRKKRLLKRLEGVQVRPGKSPNNRFAKAGVEVKEGLE